MRPWFIALALLVALAAGCTKNNTANPAPGHAPNNNSGTAGNPNAGGAGGAGGTSGGGTAGGTTQQPSGGTAGGGAQQPAGGGAAAKPPENLPQITRAQYDKITGPMTYDAFIKLVGSPGKLIAESGDKKSYQYQLKDDPKYYVNVVFNKGIFSEKTIFTL